MTLHPTGVFRYVLEKFFVIKIKSGSEFFGVAEFFYLVRSAGIEPTLQAPEAYVLSTGLRARKNQFGM